MLVTSEFAAFAGLNQPQKLISRDKLTAGPPFFRSSTPLHGHRLCRTQSA